MAGGPDKIGPVVACPVDTKESAGAVVYSNSLVAVYERTPLAEIKTWSATIGTLSP